MKLDITYSTALERHPKLVQSIMDKLAMGKSKERGSAPESLTWRYDWGVSCKSATLAQLCRGERPVETRTLDERIHCVLTASKGRWSGSAGEIHGFHPVPVEVMAYMRSFPQYKSSDLEGALRELNPTVVVLSGVSDPLTRSDTTGFHTKGD